MLSVVTERGIQWRNRNGHPRTLLLSAQPCAGLFSQPGEG